MSREVKLGILTLVVLIAMIWGYTFLKGRNLLSPATELITTYSDVTDLNVSSPVMVNGFKVGTVTKIKLNPTDVKKMDVYYLIDNEYAIPKSTIANLKSLGFVSGKGIFLEFEKPCSGSDCAKTGDKLEGKTIGLLGAMFGEDEISNYSTELTTSVRSIIANIGKQGEPGSINETVRQLEIISKNMAAISVSTNQLMQHSSQNLEKTIDNITQITGALANSNQKLEGIIANVNKVTGDLAKADLNATVSKANETLSSSRNAIEELKSTLSSTSSTLKNLSSVLTKMDSGDGSMGKLMNDKKLYNNLEAATRNLNLLLQDLRLNPKRYAHFSVFGKKQEAYVLPEEDPAVDK
ncbi:MAG TPA: MlaD family protein [Saprospiraceae bacterium]|jgi:phospholipid/cholesterol/gamma-HCH transport system substrate-binding protein|nr:MCE family protein [Saprospiraceae bacterium]HRO07326.1 MlaD family protein [Saprospiraceae bacterium]HRO72221.1 MlaD family protein [Saprospiraceae bacterium]HRP40609.1 MlaD family protein [Saprospiraceae bacterium]